MLLYKDIVAADQDEMFSDAFKVIDKGLFYEVDCAMITVKEGADVDIGANPSAEEQDEALEEGFTRVNNVVYSHRLQSTNFSQKDYLAYVKGYIKALSTKLSEKAKAIPDDKKEEKEAAQAAVTRFQKEATEWFKAAKATKEKDWTYEYYTGESMDPEGMVALLDYRDDGITPYFKFWKDGLSFVKY